MEMFDYYRIGKTLEWADDGCPRTGMPRTCAVVPRAGLLSMLGDWDSPAGCRPDDEFGTTSACPMDRSHRTRAGKGSGGCGAPGSLNVVGDRRGSGDVPDGLAISLLICLLCYSKEAPQ